MKIFIQRWAITTAAVAVAAKVVSGIHCANWTDLVIAALLLGILNAVLRPILLILSLPLLLVTLGLFTLVINAVLLYFVGYLVDGFQVASFEAAFWGGVVISLISMVLNFLLGNPDKPRESSTSKPAKPGSEGGGPIIDV